MWALLTFYSILFVIIPAVLVFALLLLELLRLLLASLFLPPPLHMFILVMRIAQPIAKATLPKSQHKPYPGPWK